MAVVTAGRRGVGRAVGAALRALPIRVLVYIACSDATTAADIDELLGGGGGFAVADAARYEDAVTRLVTEAGMAP